MVVFPGTRHHDERPNSRECGAPREQTARVRPEWLARLCTGVAGCVLLVLATARSQPRHGAKLLRPRDALGGNARGDRGFGSVFRGCAAGHAADVLRTLPAHWGRSESGAATVLLSGDPGRIARAARVVHLAHGALDLSGCDSRAAAARP